MFLYFFLRSKGQVAAVFLQHEGFLGAVGALLNYKKIDLNILAPHKLTAYDSSRLSDVGEEFHGKLEERVSNSSYHFLVYEVHEPVLHLSLILNLDEMLIVNYSVAGLDLYNYVLSLCVSLSLQPRTLVHVLCLPIYCVCVVSFYPVLYLHCIYGYVSGNMRIITFMVGPTLL